MNPYRPHRIFVEESVTASRITTRVLRRLPQVPVEVIDSTESLLSKARRRSYSLSQGKRSLVLARHRGRFFKPCPASQTRGEHRNVCCNYFVINYASNCHMECSYCYLQSHLNFPHLIVYANAGELLDELAATLDTAPDRFFRIGTGELADSLALDPLTRYSRLLVEFFAGRPNAVLEFKTKSDCVDELLALDHRGRTVVSWSMSTPFIQRTEEHKTASVGRRLKAAARCVEAGYRIAFHFDPLIHYPQWRTDYKNLIDRIFDVLPAASVSWVSVGGLRMTGQLRQVIRSRFPTSSVPLGELVPSPDGKLRYVKPIRIEMYRQVVAWLRRRAANIPLYACMERPEVWPRIFQQPTPSDEQVAASVAAGLTRGSTSPNFSPDR